MFTIQPVTTEQIAALEKKLAVSGTAITVPDSTRPNEYLLYNKQHEIQAAVTYDPATGALSVNITRKPFLVPEGVIKSGIEEALKS